MISSSPQPAGVDLHVSRCWRSAHFGLPKFPSLADQKADRAAVWVSDHRSDGRPAAQLVRSADLCGAVRLGGGGCTGGGGICCVVWRPYPAGGGGSGTWRPVDHELVSSARRTPRRPAADRRAVSLGRCREHPSRCASSTPSVRSAGLLSTTSRARLWATRLLRVRGAEQLLRAARSRSAVRP